jgi:hypothetical protein
MRKEKLYIPDVPTWDHDCDKCEYLDTVEGTYNGYDGPFDLYVCEGSKAASFLARHGNDGSHYLSWELWLETDVPWNLPPEAPQSQAYMCWRKQNPEREAREQKREAKAAAKKAKEEKIYREFREMCDKRKAARS